VVIDKPYFSSGALRHLAKTEDRLKHIFEIAENSSAGGVASNPVVGFDARVSNPASPGAPPAICALTITWAGNLPSHETSQPSFGVFLYQNLEI
jgi:hypothetical protein